MAKRKRKTTPSPRKWGYARVSTEDQDMRMQIRALENYGVDGIFKEKKSGVSTEREALKWMMHEIVLRPGDTIVVWKLDRLGRSLSGLIELVQEIEDRGAALVSLTDKIDTSTATGRFFFHIIAAMAEWERNMISERTKAGIAAKKARGERMGRPHLIKDDAKRMSYMRRLRQAGKLLDEEGVLIGTDRELLEKLNKGNPASPIESLETVRRWRRDGYPGLEE
jgi:DNA invertase Pin-like site-specific DNA recombinase